jgi:trans-aconitate 2-methyltransferase
MSYLFGDSEPAARRLALLASLFEASTRAFVREAWDGVGGLAVDLGCGPGFTTRLLADELQCQQVAGLDTSAAFIDLARRAAGKRCAFYVHDTMQLPFPCGAAELIFCRFVLTHLRDPAEAVSRWSTQLRPKGIILLEETDAIETSNRTFREYLSIVEAMLRSQSNRLYAGAVIEELRPPLLQAVSSGVRRVEVSNADAARIFTLNLQAWRDTKLISPQHLSDAMSELRHELLAIADTTADVSEITWLMRQAAFRNTGSAG